MSVPEIIKSYRSERLMSLREFAEALSKDLPEPVSYQTIKNWEDGATKPGYYTMFAIAMHSSDWRRSMALEIVQELKPELRLMGSEELKVVNVGRLEGPEDADRPIVIDVC